MRQLIWVLFVFCLYSTSCRKEENIDIKTDENGVALSLPYIWQKSLHISGEFYSNGFFKFPIIYNDNIAIPTTGEDGSQYMTMVNTTNGETLWEWNDIFIGISGDLEFFRHYISNNLLTWQQGSRSYCINLEDGTTNWKKIRDRNFEPRLFSCNENCYYITSTITRNDGYDEHIVYKGDMDTGILTEFLRANYSCEYIGPITDNGWVGGIIYINEVPLNSNLLLVTYAEPLPEWCVNSFFGLYNIQTQEWVYERKLLAPPLWNTSVFHTPIIYNDQVYANVGNNIVCHDLYTGEQLWRREFDNDFFFSGFIIEEDKIIANNENKTLYCLDPETGHSIWEGEGAGTSSRMSYLNGIVYFVGGSDGKFHAVDIETGQTVWRLDAKKLEGSESLFKTNAVYVIPGENSEKGKVIALTHMYAYCFEAYR